MGIRLDRDRRDRNGRIVLWRISFRKAEEGDRCQRERTVSLILSMTATKRLAFLAGHFLFPSVPVF